MAWMSEYDISEARRRFAEAETPNLWRGAQTLANLRDWTNENSDGWPYWQKPSKASDKLQTVLSGLMYKHDIEDITDAELRKLYTPIKAFYTRQGVAHNLLIA